MTARCAAALGNPAVSGDSADGSWVWTRPFLRTQTPSLLILALLSALATSAALTPPYLGGWLIDRGILAGDRVVVLGVAAALVGVAAVGAALGACNRWLHTRASGRVLFAMREAIYRHWTLLSPRTRAAHREGDWIARLDADVAEVQRFALDSLLALATGLLGLVGTLLLLLHLSPTLTGAVALLVLAEWLLLRQLRPRLAERTRRLRERASDLSSFFVETLSAMKEIQTTASGSRQRRRLRTLHRAYLGDLLRLERTQLAAASGPRVLRATAQGAVFAVGGLWVIDGRMSLGALVAFLGYLALASGPVQTLFGVYVGARRARVSWQRIRELTRLAPEVHSPARPRPLGAGRGAIALEGVSFRHPQGPPLLADAALRIPGGHKVWISGASGIGKSSLVDLLARHYDPDAGRILLDGVDLRELDLPTLRRQVAVVGQSSAIFTGTIADNLRYAAPRANQTALREAAERAALTPLLAARQLGLESPVGSRGAALSGGERQRLALARVLLQRPRVLILDEATSELDAESEAKIAAIIDELFAATTRIVVSHHRRGGAAGDLHVELRAGRLEPTRA